MSKWILAALALGLAACGGRASLGEDSGHSFRRVLNAQAQARSGKALPPLSADAAKIILDNHAATFGKGGGKGSGAAGLGTVLPGGAGGLLTPASTAMEMPAGYENTAPIRLQAK